MPEANVCTVVVARNLCSGCGVCAAVCPQGTLSIQWNPYGEYIAVDSQGRCSAKCNLCLQVCPFAHDAENEDSLGRKLFSGVQGIRHRSETGYWLQTSVGYSEIHNQRLNGSSGGLATWMLETLLRNNQVDYVVCVSPNSDRDKLFHYVICGTPEEARTCAKSCYYPVELSAVLRQVATLEGRYALIGLPCSIKAVRLAMQKMPVLRRRIFYLLGIVCGQQKGKFFSEYSAALRGGDPRHLVAVHFREKDPAKPASELGLRYECENEHGQRSEETVFWSQGMGQAWLARYFTLNACNYCDDLFAELADAIFMDAWLPEYSCDWRGTSIVLTRNSSLQELIEQGKTAKELVMEPLPIEKVVQSQAGGLSAKRTVLGKRLSWAKKHSISIPIKRVRSVPYSLAEGLSLTIENANMEQSKREFFTLKSIGRVDAAEFSRCMRRTAQGHKFLGRIFHNLRRITQKIARVIQT